MKLTKKQILIHTGLFLITLTTTTLAGAEWQFGRYLGLTGKPAHLGVLSARVLFLTTLFRHSHCA